MLTIDNWESRAGDRFMGVNLFWVDPQTRDWRLKRLVLGACQMIESETGIDLNRRLQTILRSFSLDLKDVLSITHDRGKGMLKGIDDLEEEYGLYSVCCAAHILHNAVEKFLSHVKETIDLCCDLVRG